MPLLASFAPLLIGPLAQIAFAPNVPAGTWPDDGVPVVFRLSASSADDALAPSLPAEFDVALHTWSRVGCTAWRGRFEDVVGPAPADDGVNVVVIHRDAWPAELIPGAIAQTVVHTDARGSYRDADIHLNAVDHAFSLDGRDGTVDLRSVLVHELGHALGLGHASDPVATMHATGSGLRWRSLEADDRAGVCALYPGTGDGGCEVTGCPADWICVAGGCQRAGDQGDVCAPCDGPTDCAAAGEGARCVELSPAAPVGRACARPCATDVDCGTGFRCLPTTSAGDLQCVSQDGCRHAANPCSDDDACAVGRCRGGACLGPPVASDEDAGPAAGGSSTPPEHAPPSGDGGCSATACASDGGVMALLGLVSLLGARWARRPRPARR